MSSILGGCSVRIRSGRHMVVAMQRVLRGSSFSQGVALQGSLKRIRSSETFNTFASNMASDLFPQGMAETFPLPRPDLRGRAPSHGRYLLQALQDAFQLKSPSS